MSDRYLEWSQTAWGHGLASMLGLPRPPRLQRAATAWTERPLEGRAAVLGAAEGSVLTGVVLRTLQDAGAQVRVRPELTGFDAVKRAATEQGIAVAGMPVAGEAADVAPILVYDASGVSRPERLHQIYEFFQPLVGRLPRNGRVVALVRAPDGDPSAAAGASAVRGFVKSLGKELGRAGTTVNLLEVAPGADPAIPGALRYLLSDHAAFVSGQCLPLSVAAAGPAAWTGMLAGKTALVTGAAQGIGAAIARVLAREGARVVGVDRPQDEGALAQTLAPLGGAGVALDVATSDAPAQLARECARLGGVDIVVHNAGITRDRLLRNMQPHHWDQVVEVNLASIVRINTQLLEQGLRPGARMVCVSSIGGIAGNAGQTNYGATKAGVIGYVRALAPELARRGGAVNAVAPGFIETRMTAAMPAGPRMIGRLMSALLQGGVPDDIAEAVAFLSSGAGAGLNGHTLRVCGQHMVGA